MANLDEKNSFKESKLFLPMVVGVAFVLGLGTTFLVLNNKERAPQTGSGGASESIDNSVGGTVENAESSQPLLNKVLGKAPSNPDAVAGGVKETLDGNYETWIKKYVYADLENVAATPAFGSNQKVPSQYFQDLNMSNKLWANNGEKIVVADGETPEGSCDVKRGQFTDKPTLDNFDLQTVGVISYPVSKKYGPHVVDGYYRQCFEYSTEGAVLAAANHIFTDIGFKEFHSVEMQRKYFYSTMRSSLKEMKFTFADKGSISDMSRVIASVSVDAFRVDRVDASGVNVMIYVTAAGLNGNVALGQIPMTMVWEKGDWRVGRLENDLTISVFPSNVTYFSEFWESADEGPYIDQPGYGNDAKAEGADHQ